MVSPRTATLLGADIIFVGCSLALFRFPELSASIYPYYGLLFFWSHLRREAEAPVIFLFLIMAAGLVLAARVPHAIEKAALLIETGGLGALSLALSWQRQAAARGQRELEIERLSLEGRIREHERDLKYYQEYQLSAGDQIKLRRDMAESARSLGSAMDARQVQDRLAAVLSSRFPRARVSMTASAEGDPVLERAASRHVPLLIKDVQADERLKGLGLSYRCVLAIPLRVMRQSAGFLKLESGTPGLFSSEDVKAADLFATMACVSLENIRFYEHIHQLAVHDPLTQLYSHRAFQGRLQEELLRAARSQTPLSLILCDLDHFKSYNDRYGHQAGDHLLRTVAAIIASFARPVDMAARYGGEEFALILPNFVRSEALDLANRLRLRVASEPFVFQGQKTNATMSLGLASFPQDATTASQMVRVADERLYRAKENGRNQAVG
ncbi:MAG: sensor domain-containing diguanylate cyclase [Elusimicrobia bacterium]|nr:sensor domain-containing diguanylate cyclase [Elusimicrobiota bacterium]